MSYELPRLELTAKQDDIGRAINEFQKFILKHPVACQSIFSMLIAEGRHAADTTEGREKLEALKSSALLTRAAKVWEASSLWMLDPDPDVVLPSGYLDALFMAGLSDNMEEIIANSFPEISGVDNAS